MKKILILGAGLSASSLIRYLLQHAEQNNWFLRVVDQDIELVKRKLNNHPNGVALNINALNPIQRSKEIAAADLVISMLPARYHVEVAKDCIKHRINLITPSYISSEMKALNDAAIQAGIVIMNEIGLDPGIDHMSAMKVIDQIEEKNGILTAFRSFCGGLIAPESDNNPWNYKFTWSPRNVVLAGQGGLATFIEQNEYKYIPYHRLLSRLFHVSIDNYGDFEGYANRDSLAYRSTYGLDNIPTIFRGTLRRKNFCEAWNVFIELGMTDDLTIMENAEKLTPRKFLNAFLPYDPALKVEDKFRLFLGESRVHLFDRFEWLGLFDSSFEIGLAKATPAQILEKLLKDKWMLDPGDKDMIVMYHEFDYTLNNKHYRITSSLVNIGEDQTFTSMANTVGLPVAIAAKMILNNQLEERGVTLPVKRAVYTPILKELETFGIVFTENHREI
jgi:saccharopine dehydrogenase-like NADP-dependent oxidoreductase